MLGSAGSVYVHRFYSLQWCLNLVCSNASAVLIKALHPEVGIPTVKMRRQPSSLNQLCSRPGRLCQALDITLAQDGSKVTKLPFSVALGTSNIHIVIGKSMGISKSDCLSVALRNEGFNLCQQKIWRLNFGRTTATGGTSRMFKLRDQRSSLPVALTARRLKNYKRRDQEIPN